MKLKKIFQLIGAACLAISIFFATDLAAQSNPEDQLDVRVFPAKLELEKYPGGGYTTQQEYVSEEIRPKQIFSSVGLTWHEYLSKGTDIKITMRFRKKDTWSQWQTISRDGDHKDDSDEEHAKNGHMDSFLAVNLSDTYQYKVALYGNGKGTPAFSNLEITAINAREPARSSWAQTSKASLLAEITQDMIPEKRAKIISRAEWGADEFVRTYKGSEKIPPLVKLDQEYLEKFSDELQIVKKITTNDKGELLTWPLEYPEKISKIIIHHTASTKNLDNPKQAIRDIYLWHALGRGWGDIGYNYILDPDGNIYEGRYGGEKVIGAHAGKSNTSSIGIAVMGNYENDEVPENVLISLAHLISEKTKIHNIDPIGSAVFRGELLPNIIGHRDVMSTSCPGKNLYSKMPLLRNLALAVMSTTTEPAEFKRQKEAGFNYEDMTKLLYIALEPDQERILPITIKNTGTVTWSQLTSLVVNNFEAHKDFVQVLPPTGRVTFPMSELREIPPGHSATFNVKVVGGFKNSTKTLELMPVISGKTKLSKYISISAQTTPAIFTYDMIGEIELPKAMKAGEKFSGWVDLKNTGNVNWQNSGNRIVRLGTDHPHDRKSLFIVTNSTRIASLQQAVVKPGEIGRFPFSIRMPNMTSSVTEYMTPVVEGVTWMADKNLKLSTFIYQKKYAANPIAISRVEAESNKTIAATVKLRNTGGITWTKNIMPVLKKVPPSRTKLISADMEETSVAPGEIATFRVNLTTPRTFMSDKVKLNAFIGTIKLNDEAITIVVKKSKPIKKATTPPASPTSKASSASSIPAASGSSTGLIRIRLGFSDTPIIKGSGPFSIETDNIANITRYIPSPETILRIDNWVRPPEWDKSLNDNEFRGTLEVRSDEKGTYVINELDVESYLKGLAETTNSDPAEKKKAIIVAARTYAVYYTTVGKGKKFPGKPYDLDDDPDHTQKYRGYGYEKRSPNSTKSVDDTHGLVVKYLGNIVITPYFSSDSGQTISALEAWGWENTPYLPSVDDPHCKSLPRAGHGVGMSGCGALGMAKNGSTYEEILKYYYKGISLEKIW